MCTTPTKCRLSLSARHAKPTPRAPCRGRRRPRNTVKNDVFEHFSNIQRKIHINLSGGFGRGSGGGIPAVQQKGRRQGRRAYITFGYQPKASGKDTGPWPASGFMRLTPDSRAPAYLGLGMCRAGSSLSPFETWWGLYLAKLSYLVRILALGWAKLSPCGLCWAHLGPKLSLCWA